MADLRGCGVHGTATWRKKKTGREKHDGKSGGKKKANFDFWEAVFKKC